VIVEGTDRAQSLAALYAEVETSGSVTITVKDLLHCVGEPQLTPRGRVRAVQTLANRGLVESPSLLGPGVHPTSSVTLRLEVWKRPLNVGGL
jgi:hypothetical protein